MRTSYSRTSFIFTRGIPTLAQSILRNNSLHNIHAFQESMKLMGLQEWCHWIAWFIHYFLFLLIIVCVVTSAFSVRINGSRVLGHSDPTVIFVFLSAYACATVCFCFMISSFFSKGNYITVTSHDRHGVINHLPLYCLFNSLTAGKNKATRYWLFCDPVTGDLPSQKAS